MPCSVYGMGVLVQIRDVEESVRDRLKENAAAEGVSLNSYLRDLLARGASVPPRAKVVERLRARMDIVSKPGVEFVLEAREERTPIEPRAGRG